MPCEPVLRISQSDEYGFATVEGAPEVNTKS